MLWIFSPTFLSLEILEIKADVLRVFSLTNLVKGLLAISLNEESLTILAIFRSYFISLYLPFYSSITINNTIYNSVIIYIIKKL